MVMCGMSNGCRKFRERRGDLIDNAPAKAFPSRLWHTLPHAGIHLVDMPYNLRGYALCLGFYQFFARGFPLSAVAGADALGSAFGADHAGVYHALNWGRHCKAGQHLLALVQFW
jgi:hypothetical protein